MSSPAQHSSTCIYQNLEADYTIDIMMIDRNIFHAKLSSNPSKEKRLVHV